MVSVPKVLMEACISIFAIVYIADCIPAAVPMLTIFLNSEKLICSFLIKSLSASFLRESTTITSIALTTCEVTVATAAPTTPIPIYFIKRISSIILIKQLIIRKISGVFESPTALKSPAPML